MDSLDSSREHGISPIWDVLDISNRVNVFRHLNVLESSYYSMVNGHWWGVRELGKALLVE